MRQQCLLAVPLLRHRETIGAIVFGSTRLPEMFQERDISRAELLAAQAMVAMENARLYGEAKGQLEETTALYEIANAARDALTSEDLAQALVDILKEHVGYDRASILLTGGALADPAAGAGGRPRRRWRPGVRAERSGLAWRRGCRHRWRARRPARASR